MYRSLGRLRVADVVRDILPARFLTFRRHHLAILGVCAGSCDDAVGEAQRCNYIASTHHMHKLLFFNQDSKQVRMIVAGWFKPAEEVAALASAFFCLFGRSCSVGGVEQTGAFNGFVGAIANVFGVERLCSSIVGFVCVYGGAVWFGN